MLRERKGPHVKGYKTRYVTIERPGGRLRLLVAEPVDKPGPVPGILWIHGGGYMLGMPEMLYMSRPVQILQAGLGVVVCPAYRLAWQAPYPAAIEDCYTALVWLKEHACELGVRDDQLFVGGESAGGGLTAALCMMARDRGQVNVAYQMPLYPMLDAFDMLMPQKQISKEAARQFMLHYLHALENHNALQNR